jgi:transposase InsO family protein/transposase-like protein
METRRQYTPEQKVAILREHLLEHTPVSDLCDKHQIHPTLFYQWQKAFFENGTAAFARQRPRSQGWKDEAKIERLETKLKQKDEVIAEIMARAHPFKKRAWGDLKGCWVAHDTRDMIIDFIQRWAPRTELPALRLLAWIGLARSKYYDWKERFGKANEHNGLVPRDHWLEDAEKKAILDFHQEYPLEGYRRLTFMMLDRDLVAVSPSSTYRVLKAAGLLEGWKPKPSRKGTGFVQPLQPHEHWHIDVSYLNISGTFFYLCSVLDGCSRYLVHWELRESMTEADVETILQRALEKHPEARPRIISDNGPQFIARDFKEFIRVAGLSHVRTAPYYPQSNGKIERWHRSLKSDCLRPGTPLCLEDARRLVTNFVAHYNTVRLHSAIGYLTPADKLSGKEKAIFAARDQKLLEARETRKTKRQQSHAHSVSSSPHSSN